MIRTFIRTTLILTIFIVPILALRISYLLASYALDYLSKFRPIRSLRNAASRTVDYILSLFFIPRVFDAFYGIATRIIRFASSFKSTSLIGRLVSQLWEMESSIYLDPSAFIKSLKRFVLSMFSFDTKRLLWTALSMPARMIFFGFAFPLMLLRSSFSMGTRMIRYITSFQPLGFLRRLVTEPSALGSIVFFDPSVIKRKLQRLVLSLLSISPRRMIRNTLSIPSRAIIFAFVLPLWFFRNAFSIGAMVFGTITSYSTSIDTNGDNLVIDFKKMPVKDEKKEMKRKVEMNILKDEFMGLMKKSPAIINKKVIVTKDDVQILDLKKPELEDTSLDQKRDVEEHNVAHHKREREEKMKSGKRDLKKTKSDEHDDVLDEKIKSDWMKQVMYGEPKQQECPLSKQEQQIKKEQEEKLQKQEKEKLQAKQKEEEIVSSYSAQIKLLPPHRREKEDEGKKDKMEEKKDIQMQAPILNEEKHEELKEKIKTEWVKQVMLHAEPKQSEENKQEDKKQEEKKDVSEILDKETKNMTPLTEVRKKRPKSSSSSKKNKDKDKKKESSSISNKEEQAQSPQIQEQLSSNKTTQDNKSERKDEEKPEQSQVKQDKPIEKKQKPIIPENIKLDLMKEVIEEDPPAPVYDVMMHAESHPLEQQEQSSTEKKESSNPKQEETQEGKQDKEEQPINNEVEERGLSYAEIAMKPAPVEQEHPPQDKLEKKEDIQMQAPIINEEKHEELKEKIKTEWVKQVMLHAEPKQLEENKQEDKKQEEKKDPKQKEEEPVRNQVEERGLSYEQIAMKTPTSEQTEPKSEPITQDNKSERKDEEKPEQSQVKQDKPIEKKQKSVIPENIKLDLMKEVIEEDPPAPVYDVMMHAESHPLQQEEQSSTEKKESSNPKQEETQEEKQDKEEQPISNEVEERGLSYAEIAMKPAPVEQEDQKISSTSSQIKLIPPHRERDEKKDKEIQAPVIEDKHKELREKKERQATDKKRTQREKEQGQEDLEKEIEMKQTPKMKSKIGLRRSNRDVNDLLEQEQKQVQETKVAIQAPLLDEEKHEELKEKIKTEWVKQVMLHAEPKQSEENKQENKQEEKKDVSEILDKETKDMTPLTEVRKKRPKPSSSSKKNKNKDKKKESSSITNKEEQAQSPQIEEQLSSNKTEPVIQSIPELKISELEEKKPEQSQVKQDKPIEKKTLLDENTKLDLMKEVIEEDPPAPVYDVMVHAESHPLQQEQESFTEKKESSNPKQEEMKSNKQQEQEENKPKQKEEEPIRNEVEERGLSYAEIAMKPPTSTDDEQKSDEDQFQEDYKSESPLPVDDKLEERRLHHEIHKIDIVEKISKEDHVMKPKRAHSIHSPSTRRTF